MRKFLFAIIAVFIGCCSVNAQNATVNGPKKHQSRTTAVKKRKANSTTKVKPSATVSSPTGYINGHGYVDLGLSVKWATCNVGASSPEGYGNYYAWGETSTKYKYSDDTYSYKNTNIGSDIKGTYYDVAHMKWGGNWRMPTKAECEELKDRCTWTWSTVGGHEGYKLKGPNGESIFLPAAGYRFGADVDDAGTYGGYWSSSVNGDFCA